LLAVQHALAQSAPAIVALTGARIIDGTGRAPLDDATLLIENGRIAAIGSASTVRIPEGATRVSLKGKTIFTR
jgi:imidazolonepropionase-like amidohydrolase